MPSSVSEEEMRVDRLQPEGDSHDELVFVELVV